MTDFKPNENFKYYMYFISERMKIFWNKYDGYHPYTEDEILLKHKFTNVYRVLDRSSQFLLSDVIYNNTLYTPMDMFWRIILYKNWNLPSTWRAVTAGVGDITLHTPIEEIKECLDIVHKFQPVYSNAYMLTCPFMRNESFLDNYGLQLGDPKYWLYLKIFRKDFLEKGIMEKCLMSTTFEELFLNLKSVLSFADFLSYQMAQDLNYTTFFNFDDNDFCAAGPGTQRGIERCFTIVGKPNYQEIVKWVQSNFEQLIEDYKVEFIPLPNNWLPKVPDLSNCFCEVDKYLRGSGIITEGKEIYGKQIKNHFTESNSKIDFVFPPKWRVKL